MTDWPLEFRRYERLASLGQVGGFRPPSTPRTSWMGQVLLGLPGEQWPSFEGRPMWGVCQIRVDELPAAPPRALDGVELVTVFIDLLELPVDTPNGEGWELRAYPSIDALAPLLEPDRHEAEDEQLGVRPFPVLWRAHVDMPDRDESPDDAYREFVDGLEDWPETAAYGLKVGGWPKTVQSEVTWTLAGGDEVEFVLQIDTDEKSGVMIGDGGLAYFGWTPAQGWLMEWQTH